MTPRSVAHITFKDFFQSCNLGRRLSTVLYIIGIVSLLGMLAVVSHNAFKEPPQEELNFPGLQENLKLSPLSNLKNEECESFSLTGTETKFAEFEGLSSRCGKKSLREIKMEFVKLDAKIFTQSLQGCTNLETISLNMVSLSNENFQRVYLPKLVNYTFDRSIGFHEQYKDYVNYTTPDKMLSMLFFDKTENQSFNFKEVFLNSKVNIMVRLDGWTVASIQNKSEVILALPYGNEILESAQTNYLSERISSLTLTECSMSETSIPRQVKYLNLYNVFFEANVLTKVIDSMDRLETLFIESPSTEIRLKNLPLTIKKISFSSINLTYTHGDCINASAVVLGLVTNPKVFENFHTLFPAAEYVAIFEPGTEIQHLLLLNILKTQAKWVLIREFTRKNSSERTTPVQNDIEILLNELKIPTDEKNFLLERDEQNIWTGRSVGQREGFELRYQLLGWEKYITVKGYSEL